MTLLKLQLDRRAREVGTNVKNNQNHSDQHHEGLFCWVRLLATMDMLTIQAGDSLCSGDNTDKEQLFGVTPPIPSSHGTIIGISFR